MKTPLPKITIENYEKLREDVLASGGNHCRGWGIFAHNGMLAWSMNQEMFVKNETASSAPTKISPIPEHLNQPLIQVLAGLILSF